MFFLTIKRIINITNIIIIIIIIHWSQTSVVSALTRFMAKQLR